MKVTEALELEMKAILTKDKGHPAYQRDDVAQVLIGIRFKDGNTHWILPCKNTTEKMSLDLSKICIESDRWEYPDTSFNPSFYYPEVELVKGNLNKLMIPVGPQKLDYNYDEYAKMLGK